MRFLRKLLAGLGILTILGAASTWFYQLRFLLVIANRLFPDLILRAPNNNGYFAITFDDGPNPPYTDEILSILARYNAKATFFFMGTQMEKYPEYAEKVVSQGHEIGNHLYSSKPAFLLSPQELEASIKKNEELLGNIAKPKFLRPSWAILTPSMFKVAKSLGYQIVLGSAYASDWLQHPRWYMKWAYSKMLQPGSIVILHDGRGNRPTAVELLSLLLNEAKGHGLKAVTLNTLRGTSTSSQS